VIRYCTPASMAGSRPKSVIWDTILLPTSEDQTGKSGRSLTTVGGGPSTVTCGTANWHCDGSMNIGIRVGGNGTSTWQIDYTVDDPTGSFPNPTLGSSGVTVFSSMSGSSTATYGAFTTPVAAIRLTLNALSSVGGKVMATILQAGIG
jgi:hypothetical protein